MFRKAVFKSLTDTQNCVSVGKALRNQVEDRDGMFKNTEQKLQLLPISWETQYQY